MAVSILYMAEELTLITGNKQEQYQSIVVQIKALIEGETDLIANLANVCAALKSQFNFFWIGFYLVKDDVLVLGPFQGPVACTRIGFGMGVCGSSWKSKKTIILDDVEAFPAHIACSSLSKSEIVIPVIESDRVVAVLDIDSDKLNHFDETDKKYLEEIISFLQSQHLFR